MIRVISQMTRGLSPQRQIILFGYWANNASNKAATEGDVVTFTITRTNTGGGADTPSTVYINNGRNCIWR